MADGYHVQAFAELARVTVRTLHHYDRMGLLKARRTPSGYRVYGMPELERLEQIAALRFLGLPLREIRAILEQEKRLLPEVLAAQRRALQARQEQLRRAVAVITDLEEAVLAGQPTTSLLAKLIEEISMQENTEFLNRYYSEGAQQTLEQRRQEWDPSQQEQVTEEWRALFREVRASLHEDPASAPAQALAGRWRKLIEQFTGSDPEVHRGVGKAWADRENWSGELQRQTDEFSDPAVWQFIQKAAAIGTR